MCNVCEIIMNFISTDILFDKGCLEAMWNQVQEEYWII